ncbi:MAG: hypothetical protein PWQ20_1582 [Thermotogaceae bacterium]|jgi:hypothetical protein|nr:hypothetical protein [Thermotogaceae bacterium]MDN5338512.1 hypothetical protein [Thermotogaceae bacterium]
MLGEVITILELLDSPNANAEKVSTLFKEYNVEISVKTLKTSKGKTDVVKILIPGKNDSAPTLGIIGQLGGVGARPEFLGLVSDSDGAIVALASALKLAKMHKEGDVLDGNVVISTHICPDAPTEPHDPVPFMGSPIGIKEVLLEMIDEKMDAILSVDTTKGNEIINVKGFAISPTVKEGYILKVSNDLLNIQERVSGKLPVVLPITMQDITPYGNDIHHINSIMQPATVTKSPVVGVAITTESAVPGCATGASHPFDLELAARFCVEVAKDFTSGRCKFYDEAEFQRLLQLYGSMRKLVGLEE